MLEPEPVEILLVEDNPSDAELALHALKKCKVANHILHVRDGAEALDFLFRRGEYSARQTRTRPVLVLLDLKLPKARRATSVEDKSRTIRGPERFQ